SWIGAPLVAGGRTMGAVSLGSDRPGALGKAELMLVSTVLAEAAIALENARLVELLSSAKREWEKTVDAISQAICIVDAHGTVRRANRVFAELIQMPVTAIPGRPWLGLLPPAWSDPVARAIAEPSATSVEIRAGERALLLTTIPMAEPGSAVLVFEDQTERRRLQEQLIQSEKMSAIGQLIAGVAHDLNNPLASVVEVNANQIKQVFVNLINNACQAIASDAPSGRIWITAKRAQDVIAVSVTDSGPGIPEDVAARVFEPFFTTKPEGEGTGLGLSICQGILKEHGGRLTLESRPDSGATFTVELPVGVPAVRVEPAPAPRGESKPLHILVVDDEPHILHYMRATL